jgi:hypothetical protein
MATYVVQLQRIWRDYEAAGMPTPATAKEVAGWAVSKGLLQPREHDPIADLAEDLARAWREEYRIDDKGRRYRAKHAVKITTSGVQYAFWADMDSAPHSHIQKALGQRRQQIVADCYQLKVDADCYNDANTERPPIQIVLDFTQDVAELQALDKKGDDDEAA